MDLFARIADHLRLLELETPRVTSTGKQIIQEDKPPQHNERDLSIQGIASGQGQQDLARNRQIPFMVQIIIKNTNQSQALMMLGRLQIALINCQEKKMVNGSHFARVMAHFCLIRVKFTHSLEI